MLLLAAGLRLLVILGYPPARVYWYDSYAYMHFALDFVPREDLNPSGYPLFLRLLSPFHSVALVAVVQHVLGLACGLLIYAILRRKAVAVWIAVAAAVPILFDASFLRLEHGILGDTLFIFLVLVAVVLLTWSPRPSAAALAAGGVLLAWAALTRTVGLPIFVLALIYLAIRRIGLRRLTVATVAGALPLVLYAGWYRMEYGSFKLVGGDGAALWARTMTFADCGVIRPPEPEARLCPNGVWHEAAEGYFWDTEAPLGRLPGGRAANDDLARSFAFHAITRQPFDYLAKVAENVSFAFRWTPVDYPRRTAGAFGFAGGVAPYAAPDWAMTALKKYSPGTSGGMAAIDPYAAVLKVYQYPAYLRGPYLAALLLLGVLGLRRPDAWLPWLTAVALLVLPIAVLDFDHRYVLPVVPFASLAAAFGVSRGTGGGKASPPASLQSGGTPDHPVRDTVMAQLFTAVPRAFTPPAATAGQGRRAYGRRWMYRRRPSGSPAAPKPGRALRRYPGPGGGRRPRTVIHLSRRPIACRPDRIIVSPSRPTTFVYVRPRIALRKRRTHDRIH